MFDVKKVIFGILFVICNLLLLTGYVRATESIDNGYNSSFYLNKKIVSLVYDDSGSMFGEKEEYANYALQALIAMLGVEDKLNIVKMSEPYTETLIDISEKNIKQNSIDMVRKWESLAETPFDAVDTASSWLLKQKEIYQKEAEYWLIIITDGQFNSYAKGYNTININYFMKNINNSFAELDFNSILLSIGSDLDRNFIDIFKTIPNCSALEANSPEDIVPAMFEISSKINSGINTQEIDAKKISNNKIRLDLRLPIYKMNIFIQKNGLEIVSIKSDKNKDIPFNTYDIRTETKTAKMNEIFMSSGYLERGVYEVEFNKDVDLDATQIKIFVQAAVENILEIYKVENQKEIKLSEIDYFGLEENDTIIAKSKLISLIDGKEIDIKELSKIDGYYYNNNNKSYGKFQNGLLVTEIILESGKNVIYSIIESEGYVNAKSNIVVIDLSHIPEVLIQYNNLEKYEKNGEITLDKSSNLKDITLDYLPEGIIIEYKNIEYSNGDKILFNEENPILIVKANKEYREIGTNIIEITANDDAIFEKTETNKSYFKIGPKTAKYEYVKVDKTQEDIDMNNGLLKLRIEYPTTEKIMQLDVNNIKKIKLEGVSIGYSITANTNSETNEIILEVVPNILSVFKERKISFNIISELKDALGIAEAEFEFEISNYNILKVLLPWIIAGIIIILLLGYLFKNRFSKKACMLISSEDQPYTIKDYSAGLKKYLPFVSDTANLPNIKIKAKKGRRIEIVSSIEEIIEVNGDTEIPKRIILGMNSGELVLKIDDKNVKYEYVALTPDEIIEASEEKDNGQENWF